MLLKTKINPVKAKLAKFTRQTGVKLLKINNFNSYLKNGFWVSTISLISGIAGLLSTMVITRFLPTAIFGQYQFLLSLTGLATIFALPGLRTSFFQASAKGYDQGYPIFIRISFLFSLLGSVFLLGAAFLLLKTSPDYFYALCIIAVLNPFLHSLNFWESLLESKSLFKKNSGQLALQNILSVILIVTSVFLLQGFQSNLILVSLILAYFLPKALTNILFTFKNQKYLNKKNAPIKKDLIYGFSLTALTFLQTVAAHIDKLAVAFLLGIDELALYSLAIYICRKVFDLVKKISIIINPKLAQIKNIPRLLLLKIFILGCLITVLLIVSAPYLVPLLFGAQYREAIRLIQIMILGFPFFELCLMIKNHLVFYLKNEKIIFINYLIAPLIKLLLMFLLAFFSGVYGLALALSLQYPAELLLLFILKRIF